MFKLDNFEKKFQLYCGEQIAFRCDVGLVLDLHAELIYTARHIASITHYSNICHNAARLVKKQQIPIL